MTDSRETAPRSEPTTDVMEHVRKVLYETDVPSHILTKEALREGWDKLREALVLLFDEVSASERVKVPEDTP